MRTNLRIVVTGLIAQHPLLGGMTWHYLHYVLGLRRLGHDVYYVEDSGQWPYRIEGGASREQWTDWEGAANVEHVASVMERFGMGDRWAYHLPIRDRWYGMSSDRRREIIRSSDLVLNVSGSLSRPWQYREGPRLVYIDTDPVFTQVKLQLPRGTKSFQKRVAAHDVYFSFGEQLAKRPTPTGLLWRPTRQPVVLDAWRASEAPRHVFSTVMSWTSFRPLVHKGRSYGQKDVEFRAFLELPSRVHPVILEIACNKTPHRTWQRRGAFPLEHLTRYGWRMVDAAEACGTLDRYRDYIKSSRAEWSVAKHGYVVDQPGWFSDRSACYLAAGRPVVVQDTGFRGALPVGNGLLAFRTMAEAVEAIREIEGNYERHAKAALAIADEFFNSDGVLSRLLEESMTRPAGN